MKCFDIAAVAALAAAKYATAATSFAGTNNMFAHALSEADQETYISQLYADNVKVVRLWVDGVAPGLYGDYSGTYCEKGSAVTALAPLETTPTVYNDASLEAIDSFMGRLYNLQPSGQDRIKVIISPHNANALTSGTGFQDVYGEWYGTGSFYTDSNAISYYKQRLSHIINYESPWFGVPWKNLTYMILAFDIQNEPMNEVGDPASFSGNGWLCTMAEYMRNQLGSTNQIKIATGGYGGGYTNYNIESVPTSCDSVDIISLHGYQSESTWANYIPSAVSDANGKLVMVEEWGVDGDSVPTSQWSPTCSLFNKYGVPWLYWEIIPGKDSTQSCSGTCCGDYLDGYEIGAGSSKVSPAPSVEIASANAATATQTGWANII